jgi:probable rRNA maturation factor
LTFDLTISARAGLQYVPYLRRMIPRAQISMRSVLRELSLALVGERQMRRLHKRFMHVDSSTDVLSFDLEHDRRGRVIAGEIVVCVPVARKQARASGTDVRDELLLYAIHGMLHLSGLDDRTAAAYQAMHRREDHILALLGVGPVFAAKRKHR